VSASPGWRHVRRARFIVADDSGFEVIFEDGATAQFGGHARSRYTSWRLKEGRVTTDSHARQFIGGNTNSRLETRNWSDRKPS
jgi:hypothetical protein